MLTHSDFRKNCSHLTNISVLKTEGGNLHGISVSVFYTQALDSLSLGIYTINTFSFFLFLKQEFKF